MVTYEMLTGLPPWYTTDKQKLFDRLRNAPLKFPFYVSKSAASFIHVSLSPPSLSPSSPLSLSPDTTSRASCRGTLRSGWDHVAACR
jgi:serine/threonine protein kinase